MVTRRLNIKKILVFCCWLLAGSGMLVLLVAAIRRGNVARCENVEIAFRGKENNFLNRSDIWSMMGLKGPQELKGRPLEKIDLVSLEKKLKGNSWVQGAELFFDKKGILQVRVTERKPIARIFTGFGASYYIDSSGKYLPLGLGKPAMRLPVFTGMPEKADRLAGRDSLVLKGVKEISRVLTEDAFWQAQVTQVDLDAKGNFDLVPLVGKHLVHFGDGSEVADKFRRLGIFYKQVLNKTGIDYYKSVSVAFDKQVIGEKDGPISTSVDKKNGPGASPASPLAVNSSSTKTTKINGL